MKYPKNSDTSQPLLAFMLLGLVSPATAEQPVVLTAKAEGDQTLAQTNSAAKSAHTQLQVLQIRKSRGEAVSTEALAAAHETALLAEAAARRARFRATAESYRTDPEARALRHELLAAETAAERRAVLARHMAVEHALQQEIQQ